MTTKSDIQALLLFLHNAFIVDAASSLLEPLEPPEPILRLSLKENVEAYSVSSASVGYLNEI